IRPCTSSRQEDFKSSASAVSPRPRDSHRKKSMEAASGFEPLHRGFADLRLSHLATPPCATQRGASLELPCYYATPLLTMRAGAGNGIRTRDPNLGKVVLYH